MKKVVFVGAGNVANSLAQAVAKLTNMQIVQVYSRSIEAAQLLASKIDCGICYVNSFADINPDADIYFFAIKDDVLPKVIRKVQTNSEALHLHTAGSHGLDIFGTDKPHCGVLYPFQTFTKTRTLDFNDIPLFVEAKSNEDKESIMQIAKMLSTQVFEFNAENRKYLHLAGVYANNFANAMFIEAQNILKHTDLPSSVLLPLIREMVNKLSVMPALQAQTGPAARHDTHIIERQVQLIDSDLQKQIYQLISDQIIQWTSQPT